MNVVKVFFLALIISVSVFSSTMSFAFENSSQPTYGEWVNLIDGNLDDFIKRGGEAVYELKDGILIGKTRPDTPNTFLSTKKDYANFELTFEFNVDPKLNSGVQFRSNVKKTGIWPFDSDRVWGYQSEIDPSDRAWSAGIYEEGGRGWLNNLKDNKAAQQAFKQNQWNKVRILAVGHSLKTWINGVAAADLTDSKTASGFIAFQVHNVSYDEERHVQWKNIKVREITLPKKTALIEAGKDYAEAPEGADILIANASHQMVNDDDEKSDWSFEKGVLQVGDGDSYTPKKYRDFQAHIEFNVNEDLDRGWQQNGNSGFYIQQRYEVQILNSFGQEPHPQSVGGIYKIKAADVNASKKHGEWQSYDIIFREPRWQGDEKIEDARITVIHNGVLIQDDVAIPHETGAGKDEDSTARPIKLQDHSNPVKYRNFWVKELNIN